MLIATIEFKLLYSHILQDLSFYKHSVLKLSAFLFIRSHLTCDNMSCYCTHNNFFFHFYLWLQFYRHTQFHITTPHRVIRFTTLRNKQAAACVMCSFVRCGSSNQIGKKTKKNSCTGLHHLSSLNNTAIILPTSGRMEV